MLQRNIFGKPAEKRYALAEKNRDQRDGNFVYQLRPVLKDLLKSQQSGAVLTTISLPGKAR